MAKHKSAAAVVATYGDHEVITPENTLRKALTFHAAPPGGDDPVSRAEKALAGLAGEFGTWMCQECERLDRARRLIVRQDFTGLNRDAFFRAAHDIKGEAATFGYPAMAAAADSLCRLVEFSPDANRIPRRLIDQHVDAIRAIYREYADSDAEALADSLAARLRNVTDEFLLEENRNRPDVLARIKSPSLVPDDAG